MSEDVDDMMKKRFQRQKELMDDGLERGHAVGIVDFEYRINQWPTGWGDDLVILIYGDFHPISEEITIEGLGITISPVSEKNTVINALTVHRATVKVSEKSKEAIIDAVKRINLFLGIFSLVTWGNANCNWWSFITHGNNGGVIASLVPEDLNVAINSVLSLDPKIRKKVDDALFWFREANSPIFTNRMDTLRVYAAHWNAFECLVDAVEIAVPMPKNNKAEKQAMLMKLYEENGNRISPKYIHEAYNNILKPGIKIKSVHALNTCFDEMAAHYIDECFNIQDEANRLYNIRNAINHGDIDAENPVEIARIEARDNKLGLLLLGMFGRIVRFSYPADRVPRD